MQYRCDEKESEPSQQTLFTDQGGFGKDSLFWIRDIFRRFPTQTCETSPVNLFAWGPIYDYRWFLYRGRLLIYDSRHNYLIMPVGCPMTPQELYTLAHDMMDHGLSHRICQVSKAYLTENPEVADYFTVTADRNAAEYVYETSSLVHLNSEKLHKKKNLVSQFHRLYPVSEIVPLDKKLRDRCLAFVRDQLDARSPVPQSLEDEFSAMKRAFASWKSLGLGGLALLVERKIAAFSVFSRLNRSTFNVHFEKSDLAFKGAAQVINQETARFLENRCSYINREQDLGIPGLRQAKLSYEPYRLLVPHVLQLKTNA